MGRLLIIYCCVFCLCGCAKQTTSSSDLHSSTVPPRPPALVFMDIFLTAFHVRSFHPPCLYFQIPGLKTKIKKKDGPPPLNPWSVDGRLRRRATLSLSLCVCSFVIFLAFSCMNTDCGDKIGWKIVLVFHGFRTIIFSRNQNTIKGQKDERMGV